MNFHNCHGIIGVGGDGIIWEILNGIMQRNDWRKVISKVFIGVIPCGNNLYLYVYLKNFKEEVMD